MKQTSLQRAQRLPALVPGQVITVPLELLPIYLTAHRLEVMTLAEVGKLAERTGERKAADVVLVKRETE